MPWQDMCESLVARWRSGRCLAAAAVVLASGGATDAQVTSRWIAQPGSNGFFSDAANWDQGVPGADDTALFESAQAFVLLDVDAVIGDLEVLNSSVVFELGGRGLTVVGGVRHAQVGTAQTSLLRFADGHVEARRVACFAGSGAAQTVFEGSAGLSFGQQPPNARSIEAEASQRSGRAAVVVEGPIGPVAGIRAGQGGVVLLSSDAAGMSAPVVVRDSVETGRGGRLIAGRPLQSAGFPPLEFRNAGVLDVADLSGVLSINGPFTNRDPDGRRGLIKLDVSEPDLSDAEGLFVSDSVSLGGALELCGPAGFQLQTVGFADAFVAGALDGMAPTFDIFISPFGGEGSYVDLVPDGGGLMFESTPFRTDIRLEQIDAFSLLGLASDGVIDDFDRDGLPDLVAAVPDGAGPNGSVVIVFGEDNDNTGFTGFGQPTPVARRDGGERRATIMRGVSSPSLVASVDIDGDGDDDLATANVGDSTVEIRLNDGTGSFIEPPFATIPLGGEPVDLESGEFVAGMGSVGGDFAVVINKGPLTMGSVLFLTSDGGGVILCETDVGPDPDGSDPVDVDGAASADLGLGLAVTSLADDTIEVLLNDAVNGIDGTKLVIPAGVADPSDIAAGDLDGDGFPDLAVLSENGGTLTVFRNVESGGERAFLASATLAASLSPASAPQSVELIDVDEDDDADIVFSAFSVPGALRGGGESAAEVSRGEQRIIQVVRNLSDNSAQTIELQTARELPGQNLEVIPAVLIAADLDQDRSFVAKPDDLTVLGASFTPEVDGYVLASDRRTPCLADVNRDGMLNGADFNAWLSAYNNQRPSADQNLDGELDGSDFNAWLANFAQGCD